MKVMSVSEMALYGLGIDKAELTILTLLLYHVVLYMGLFSTGASLSPVEEEML